MNRRFSVPPRSGPLALLFLMALVPPASLGAQGLLSPEDFFGHPVGADYHLTTYEKAMEWFDHLAAISGHILVLASSPNDLASWLQECLQAAWEQEAEDSSLPKLLMLGLLDADDRVSVIRKVREIAGAEAAREGYLGGAAAYFQDLRKAEGRPGLKSRRPQRKDRGSGLVLP